MSVFTECQLSFPNKDEIPTYVTDTDPEVEQTR